MQRGWTWVLGMATLGSLGLFWLTNIPLGVPGEWVWSRISYPAEALPEFFFTSMMLLFAGAVYMMVCWKGHQWIEGSCTQRCLALLLLCVSGFWWLSALQETPPSPHAREKSVWVLFYPSSSGYFTEARTNMVSVGDFLAAYEQKMSEGDVLHVGTHPPGLFLLSRAVLQFTESFPELSKFINNRASVSMNDALDALQQNERRNPLQVSDRAALVLIAWITQWIAVLTILPLYRLVRLLWSRETAWKVCTLWPLVPAAAIFLPKSDLLYPALGTGFLALWLSALNSRSWRLAACSGLVYWCGLFCSLALLPVALLAALWTVIIWNKQLFGKLSVSEILKGVGYSVGTFLLLVLLSWWCCNLPLFSIWHWNYENHAGFYDQYPRTWWNWLLVNPWELIFALGVPLALAATVSGIKSWGESDLRWFLLAPVLIWGLLWLSGKNQGEAARLWVFLMPWFCWMTAPLWETDRKSATTGNHFWQVVLLTQIVACVGTVLRVFGFDFSFGS